MLYVIHALDKPGALDIRKANRDAHLAHTENFAIQAGGPLLDDDGNMCGSLLIIDAADRAEVDAFVEHDPYTRAGLFARVEVRGFQKVMWPR